MQYFYIHILCFYHHYGTSMYNKSKTISYIEIAIRSMILFIMYGEFLFDDLLSMSYIILIHMNYTNANYDLE